MAGLHNRLALEVVRRTAWHCALKVARQSVDLRVPVKRLHLALRHAIREVLTQLEPQLKPFFVSLLDC